MHFLVDAQLPPALARWLTERGYPADHVRDLNLANAEDSEIWDYATAANSTIITKDEDFAERISRRMGGPVIIWLRVGNTTNRFLLAWIEPRWPSIIQLLNDGHRLVEVK